MTTHEIEHVRIIGFFHKKWPRRGSEPKSEGHMLVARTHSWRHAKSYIRIKGRTRYSIRFDMLVSNLGTKKDLPEIFVRKSSGITRTIRPVDAFLLNCGVMALMFGLYMYSVNVGFFSNVDVKLALIVSVLLMTPQVLTYSLFTATMPRSGGDYVFISRSINLPVGFVANFVMWYTQLMWIGLAASLVSPTGVSVAFATAGFVLKDPNLSNLAGTFVDPLWSFVIGSIVIVGAGLALIHNVRTLFRLQNALYIIAIIGTIPLVGLLAFSSREYFVSQFNTYMAPYLNMADSYSYIIQQGQNAGLSFSGGSVYVLLSVVVSWVFFTGFAYFTNYSAGEQKGAHRFKVNFASMFGSLIFSAGLVLVIAWLLEQVAGHDFIASIFYLYTTGAVPELPIAPYAGLFAGLLTDNPIVVWTLNIGIIAWTVLLAVVIYMMLTRIMFAWSFDKLFPKWISDISPRFKSPVNATITTIVLGELFLAAYILIPSLSMYIMSGFFLAQNAYVWLLTGVAAVVFPTRKKELYESGPKHEIAGVPLIRIAGLLTVAQCLFNLYFLLSDPNLGVNTPFAIGYSLIFMPVLGIVVFYLAKTYRKRQGIDIGLAQSEIPPE